MPANTTNETDANDTGSSESSLVWGTSSFEPGSDVGLVSRHTVGLIERDNPSTRDRLWQLVADDAPVDDILDELSSTGLKALPDFGIAQVEGDAVRVVARGRTTITAELASGDEHEIDPSGVRTWIEEVVTDVVGLTLSLSPLDDASPSLSGEAFAVLAGSVPARSLTRRFDVADPHADDAIAGWTATPGAAEADVDSGEDLSSESADARGPELDAAEEVEPEKLEPFADDTGDGDSSSADDADDAPVAEVPPQPGDPAVAATPSPPVDPQPASPQPTSPQPVAPQPSGPPVRVGATADPYEVPADIVAAAPPPSGPGTGGPPPEATVGVGPDDGPLRGPVSSIFDDDVVAEPVIETRQPDDPMTGAAGADLGDTAAPTAPSFYAVLAFSNGERIGVDRSVLIGRNPKVAGAVEGGLPHIMKFDGPGQGLSRTHAEVRVENGELLIEDLQSTNGTEIQLPGQQRRRLRAGEPVVVVPGTLIDFGDELHCTIETSG